MEELYARIEDYLDNVLPETERAAFEADVQSDPALARALAEVREARERLRRHWEQESADAELRSTLKNLGKQHFGASEKSRRLPLGRWWMAAAAALAALVVWLAWPPGEDALYEDYRKFPEASFTLRSGNGPNLDQAAAAFNSHNYSAALGELNARLIQQPDDLEVRFYAGLCRLELGQLTEAEAAFQQIIAGENAWSDDARWYLALTYLRDKKTEKCKRILQQLAPNNPDAQALLKKL